MKVNHDKLIMSTIYSKLRPNSKYLSHIDKYPNITAYLMNRYDDGYDTIREILDRIKFHIENRPVCKVCGNRVKYAFLIYGMPTWKEHCSSKCSRISASKSTKKTCLERYGVDNVAKLETTKQKYRQTCLEKYGVDNVAKSETSKQKSKQTCLKKYGVEYSWQSKETKTKIKQTCLEKYGFEYINQSKEIKEKTKQTCLEKYGVDNFAKTNRHKQNISKLMSSKDIQNKRYKTLKENHTFNTSKPEELLYNKLVNKYGKDDVIRQYKSEVYPFACDFYIRSKDLYIELQGTWTHGKHAFNPNSEEDNLVLEQWKEKAKTSRFYKNAIETWTIRDVNKRKIAKENNLNYIEIWMKINTSRDLKF